MPIDVKDFIAPVDDYSGLYRLGDDLFRNKQFDAQEKDKRIAVAQKAQTAKNANKASMAKFLVDYTNPKEHLSGSPTDPVVVKGLSDALQYGEQLIKNNKDLTTDQLLGQLAPIVGKISQYAQSAKVVSGAVADQLKNIPEGQGYNKMKLAEVAKKQAFFNPDGTPKDLSEINADVNYVAEAVKNNPEEVTDNKGLDEWIKPQQRLVNSRDVIHYNSKGGRDRKKVKTTAYEWAVPETDASGVNNGKFVPEYDEIKDVGNVVTHEFVDKDGKKTTAPVRMITDRLFHSIMSNSPGTADFVRGQVLKAIKSGEYKDANGDPITIDSPQANILGKAILYDELKTRGLGGMEDIIDTKPTQIKNVTNVRLGKDVPVIDVYKTINEKAEEHLNRQATINGKVITGLLQANLLDDNEQEVVLKKARLAMPSDEKMGIDDIYLKKDADGIYIYRVQDNKPLTKLTPIATNLIANQSLGVKSKQKAVKEAQGNETKTTKAKIAGF